MKIQRLIPNVIIAKVAVGLGSLIKVNEDIPLKSGVDWLTRQIQVDLTRPHAGTKMTRFLDKEMLYHYHSWLLIKDCT